MRMRPGSAIMPVRPLSPEEMEEVENLEAYCGLDPRHLPELLAELIRRRKVDAIALRFRISAKLRAIFEELIPARVTTREWYEAGAEDAIDDALHQPDPLRPHRSF